MSNSRYSHKMATGITIFYCSMLRYYEIMMAYSKYLLQCDIGYVYTGSDMFRSICDRIHYGRDPLCLHGTGLKLERYDSIRGNLHKWIHLVPDSRSYPYRIHQVLRRHKAYPYQFCTGSKRIRSHVNAAIDYV